MTAPTAAPGDGDTAEPVPSGGPVAEPVPEYTHQQIMRIVGVLIAALFVACISGTVISTALPTIVGDLGGERQIAWFASAGLLTTTACTPLWGRLSDLYGRKRLFRYALVIYTVTSAMAGLAQNMPELIGARAAQGVGIAGITALTQAIMADITTPRTRGRYSGYIGGAFGVATVAGPLVGGFLVGSQALGWRWCFYVGIPFAVVALLLVNRVINLPFKRREVRVDYLGAGLITGTVTTVCLVLAMGGIEWPWNSGLTWGLSALGIALGVCAAFVERRAHQPILPPHLFSTRTFRLSGVGLFFVGFAMFGAMIYLPQYLQIARDMSPTRSGLMTLPMVIGNLGASLISGKLITRFGRWKIYPTVGLPLIAVGTFLLGELHRTTPLPLVGGAMLILGVGLGLSSQTLVLAIQNTVHPSDMGVATSAGSFFRSMGGAVGVAVYGAVLNQELSSQLPKYLEKRHAVPPSGMDFGQLIGSPDAIQALAQPLRGAVLDAFAVSVRMCFVVAAPLVCLGIVAVLAIRETTLRATRVPGKDVPGQDGNQDADAARRIETGSRASG